jgi:hypothetical protein
MLMYRRPKQLFPDLLFLLLLHHHLIHVDVSQG